MIDNMIRCKNLDVTNKIDCLYQWFDKCPPKGGLNQWKDERSAKETAKHWLYTIPASFKEILKSHDLKYNVCSPEFVTIFDNYGKKSNGRNHDLVILAKNALKKSVLVSVESKADETFAETILDTIIAAEIRFQNNPNSEGLKRIEDLRLAIFGILNNEQLPLRYQLLTAIAGTFSEARLQKSKRAIFLVQTFVFDGINKRQHQQNQDDLNSFVKYLTKGDFPIVEEGKLVGPIKVPGNKFIPNDIELWIGKYQIEI